MTTKPLDPYPWKCVDGVSGRFALGSTGFHTDCLKWKPRKGYEQSKKKHFKQWYKNLQGRK